MHQARGSQRMTRSFQAQIARRDAPKLRVNQRHQLVSRFVVSTAQLFEKRRDVTRGSLACAVIYARCGTGRWDASGMNFDVQKV